MNKIERVKKLQTLVGAVSDGIIGPETLAHFARKYDRTRAQTIHFFASIHHESGGFTIGRENLNYTTSARIMQIFGLGMHSAAITEHESRSYIKQPYALAERVYGLGNPRKAKELGNVKHGDGWNYRGGGALQCTGGLDYRRYGGDELYTNPGLIETSAFYFDTAIKEFDYKNIWVSAKDLSISSTRTVCKIVNGGYNGIEDRIAKVAYYANILK